MLTSSKRRAAVVAAVAVGFAGFLILSARHQRARAPRKVTIEAMGTFVTIQASSPKAEEAIVAAAAEIDRLERLLSSFIAESDASRISVAAKDTPVAVSPATVEVLQVARKVSSESRGAFDVTVGPLVALWKKAAKAGKAPSDAEIGEAGSKVRWQALHVDAENSTVTKTVEGLTIDLGAVAKGYIAQRAVDELVRLEATSGFVEAGGDIVFLGVRPDGKPWSVGVSDPRNPDTLAEKLLVSDMAVVTSGNYRRFSVIDSKRYSHIIDARTGRPADGPAAVTVVAKDAGVADAWATALSVLGQEGAEAAREADVEYMMYFVEDDELVRVESPGFSRFRSNP